MSEQSATEKVAAIVAGRMQKSRAEAGRAVKRAVLSAAADDKLSAKDAEAAADSLAALNWTAEDFKALVDDHKRYLIFAAAAPGHPARVEKAEADLRRALEIDKQVEALTAEARTLRATSEQAHRAVSGESAALDEWRRKNPWLYDDSPPPDRPPTAPAGSHPFGNF